MRTTEDVIDVSSQSPKAQTNVFVISVLQKHRSRTLLINNEDYEFHQYSGLALNVPLG